MAKVHPSTKCRGRMAEVRQPADVLRLVVWASGQKLLFMGGEFGQAREWNHDRGLDWDLMKRPRRRPAPIGSTSELRLPERACPSGDMDDTYEGFEWIDFHDADNCVVAFLRRSREGSCWFWGQRDPGGVTTIEWACLTTGFTVRSSTPMARPTAAVTSGNLGGLQAEAVEWQGRTHSIVVNLPPLAVIAFKRAAPGDSVEAP